MSIVPETVTGSGRLDVLAGHLSRQYRLEQYTADARRALTQAQEEARQLQHNHVGTGHLLLGLASVEQGAAARALARLGVDPAAIRRAVAFAQSGQESNPLDLIVPFRHVDRALALAADEALRLSHHFIGTGHLLLGLSREPESVAAGVLAGLSIQLEQVRQTVLEIVRQQEGDPS